MRGSGWLADAGRFGWALVVWNGRKTVFVLRRRRGPCPCHEAGDSGLPGQTRCAAVLHWDDPGRFRRVCPLLRREAAGWRCTAPVEAVRPFWGRAAGYGLAAAFAIYLLGVTAVFGGLRFTGLRAVAWWQVAWPGAWHRIPEAQSQRFFYRAIEAFRRGRVNEAYLELSSASARDPANYDAALMLAQIAMFQGSLGYSDVQFQRLMRAFPENAERTAITYHDALLALNRPDRLAEHALAMAGRGTPRTAQWIRALVLALQLDQSAARFTARHHDAIAALAPHAQQLLEAVVRLQSDRLPAAKQLLRAPFEGPRNATYMVMQIDLLLQMGETDAARILLGHYRSALPAVMAASAQYGISRAAQDDTLASVDFEDLLRQAGGPGALEEVVAALVRYPSAACFARLDRSLRSDAGLRQRIAGEEVWLAAVACGEPQAARYWAGQARRAFGVDCPPIRRIDYWSMDLNNPESVPSLISFLSLPREVIAALLSRVRPPVVSGPAGR